MSHSIISFKNKYIRSKDYKIVTLLFLAVIEIDRLNDCPKWLTELRNAWLEEAQLAINGCINPQLERHLDSQEKLIQFRKICIRIINKLESFENEIPKEFINQLCEYKAPFNIQKDNKTQFYLSFCQALLRLIDGNQMEEIVSA